MTAVFAVLMILAILIELLLALIMFALWRDITTTHPAQFVVGAFSLLAAITTGVLLVLGLT